MPFPIVSGIPKRTPVKLVSQLRRDIVAVLVNKLNCSPAVITPFFPKDWLDAPVESEDGGKTIYIRLDTGMLDGWSSGEEADNLATELTGAVAQVVFDAFHGEIEVECFIGDLVPKWRTLLKPSG